MKILVIKRDKIGDMLLTTPMLRLLRTGLPGASIHVLANDYNAWVLEGNKDVDRIWVYPRAKHGGRLRLKAAFQQISQLVALRREKYDFVFVANGSESHRGIRRATSLGAARVVAYVEEARRYPKVTDPLRIRADEHEAIRLAKMIKVMGLEVPETLPEPIFSPPQRYFQEASAWLASRNLAAGAYCILGVGARRIHKQPTSDQILRWAENLKERFGLVTVLVWTPGRRGDPLYPGDDDLVAPVLRDCPKYIHPFKGSLSAVVGLTWQARTSVFPDSGLMHLAAVSPGGVVGLFSDVERSAHPRVWGPIGTRAVTLVAAGSVAELPEETVYDAIAARISDATTRIT